LSECGCLLIASDAPDGKWDAKELQHRRTEIALAVAHLRQYWARDAKQLQELGVPRTRPNVEQHGSRGIRRVGDVQRPGRELIDEEAVDRAETHFAPRGALG
jgi:hypothetical protein